MDSIVSMTGRLGTEVERRTSRNGTEYVKFRLGTTRRVHRDGEWTDSDTTWVSVRCYRHLAVNAHYSLRKGDPVIVVGRLRVETWVTESGAQRQNTVLDADAVGPDLTWGRTRFSRGERRHHAEPASARDLDAEVVDPETGEIVHLTVGRDRSDSEGGTGGALSESGGGCDRDDLVNRDVSAGAPVGCD